MSAMLVALTEPAPHLVEQGVKTAEDLIVYCARVSNPSNQSSVETGEHLLKYCVKKGHWSVFETASMTVEIHTSRAISAQLLRHRSFTFQEFSQRYAAISDFALARAPEARMQDTKNRQSSLPCEDEGTSRWWENVSANIMDLSRNVYDQAVEKGIAKEVARMVLPLATPTRLYMTGSVRSWIHYLEQRLDVATQLEHRFVAIDVADVFCTHFPTIAEATGLKQKMLDALEERE